MSRDALRQIQLGALRRLIAALDGNNPFYTPILRGAGITADVPSLEAFCTRLPLTSKAQIAADQRDHPPFGANLTYPLSHYTRFHQTSGSTAAPLRWLDTNESWQWMLGNWQRVYEAAGVTGGDRVCFAFSFGPFLGFWTAFEAAQRMGVLCLPGGGLSSSARLRLILDNAATVLCCTPTYALRLAEVARQEHIDLTAAKVRLIIVAGEPGGSIPATRAAISAAWNDARVFDHHGMTEVGPVTYECPSRPGVLHVIEASYLAEIIDPATLQPLPAGQTGELVLTNLGRFGSPLLRYRTGDLVTADSAEVCACGSAEMALVGGIIGRADDMVLVRGVNVYPSAVDQIIRSHADVAEYQVDVTLHAAMVEMRVSVEPVPACAADEAVAARVALDLQRALSLRIPVRVVAPGTLPRHEMKSRRWIKHQES